MGLEIRRVPPNWEHPKKEYYDSLKMATEKQYIPLFDEDVEEAFTEWLRYYQAFKKAIEESPDNYSADEPYREFCEYHGYPPRPDKYRPKWRQEPTWYQIYETVFGTPITPAFATQQELIDYLCNCGTFSNNGEKWDRERAENFVKKYS